MQVAALFMIAKKLTQRLINWYMDKERMAYIYTPDYNSAIKRNKVLIDSI